MNSNKTIILIAVAAVIIVTAGIALYLVPTTIEPDYREHFGLTSTKLSMTPGSEEDLSVWDLPNGCTYSDIQWSSDNPDVVTVDNGHMTAKSLGTTVIYASVSAHGRSFKDNCTVTVCESVESQMLAYNVASNMDYAVMTGSGFTDGLLALTFNVNGTLVVSLPGYDPAWLDISSSFIGSAGCDFTTTEMKILDSKNNLVAYGLYENSRNTSPENGGTGSTASGTQCYSTLLTVDNIDYGHYNIVFTLKYNLTAKTVTGSFDYMQGDGLRDASGTYCRSYAWKTDVDNSGTVKKCSFKAEYSYGEYVDALMRYNSNTFNTQGVIRNYDQYSDVKTIAQSSETVGTLADNLKSEYTKAYLSTDYEDQKFAQFVLTFLQIAYDYEYDYTQYYINDPQEADRVDVWAYPQQTVFSGFGDCEDTSILLASLYKYLGFPSGLALLPSHMVATVSLDSYSNLGISSTLVGYATEEGRSYYFCETTVFSPVKCQKMGGSVHYYVDTKELKSTDKFGIFFLGMLQKSYEGTEFTHITI